MIKLFAKLSGVLIFTFLYPFILIGKLKLKHQQTMNAESLSRIVSPSGIIESLYNDNETYLSLQTELDKLQFLNSDTDFNLIQALIAKNVDAFFIYKNIEKLKNIHNLIESKSKQTSYPLDTIKEIKLNSKSIPDMISLMLMFKIAQFSGYKASGGISHQIDLITADAIKQVFESLDFNVHDYLIENTTALIKIDNTITRQSNIFMFLNNKNIDHNFLNIILDRKQLNGFKLSPKTNAVIDYFLNFCELKSIYKILNLLGEINPAIMVEKSLYLVFINKKIMWDIALSTYDDFGIKLDDPYKKELIYDEFIKRIEAINIKDLSEYRSILKNPMMKLKDFHHIPNHLPALEEALFERWIDIEKARMRNL